MERKLSSRLLSSPPQLFLASLPLLARPAAKTRANAAGLWSLAAWMGSIRSITPISSATPLSRDHMVLSDRGMALGRWRPTVVADCGWAKLKLPACRQPLSTASPASAPPEPTRQGRRVNGLRPSPLVPLLGYPAGHP